MKKAALSLGTCLYVFVCILAVIASHYWLKPGDEMGFGLVFFYVLIPLAGAVAAGVFSFWYGIKGVVALLAVCYLGQVAPGLLFSGEHVWWGFDIVPWFFILPVFGFAVGLICYLVENKKAGSKENLQKSDAKKPEESVDEKEEKKYMNPVCIYTANDSLQAKRIVIALEECGIPAYSQSVGSGGYMNMAFGNNSFGEQIFVDKDDAQRAEKILGLMK